jgi:hypothetical protein
MKGMTNMKRNWKKDTIMCHSLFPSFVVMTALFLLYLFFNFLSIPMTHGFNRFSNQPREYYRVLYIIFVTPTSLNVTCPCFSGVRIPWGTTNDGKWWMNERKAFQWY